MKTACIVAVALLSACTLGCLGGSLVFEYHVHKVDKSAEIFKGSPADVLDGGGESVD